MHVRPVPDRTWDVVDLLVGLLAVALGVVVSANQEPNAHEQSMDALGYILIGVAGGSLVIRRRHPVVAPVLCYATAIVFGLLQYPGEPVMLMLPLTMYWASTYVLRPTGYVIVAGGLVSLVAFDWYVDDGPGLADLVIAGWCAAAVFAADAVRARRGRRIALAEREREAEAAREAQTQQLVAEERLRIARDLHDSIGHSLATINVHAGLASHVLHNRPEQALEAVELIRSTSAQTLDELGSLLGMLRRDDDGTPLDPPASLCALPALVETTRRAGVDVRLSVLGEPEDDQLAARESAAYRIVQESLTNVIRHAEATTATVTVHHEDGGALLVEVSDDGRGANGAPEGRGLLGIRERAEASGGRLVVAGPKSEGRGFRVVVRWWGRE